MGYTINTTSTKSIIEEAKNLYECWDTLERDQKRNIIETIVDKIIVDKEDIEINLYKLLPEGYMPSFLENKTNGYHTIYGVTPICNIQINTKKPLRLPLPPLDDTSLGAELKRQLISLEWTQQETANYFKVLKDSYQKWEWNQGKPHIRNMKKVVEFLGYSYWDDGTNSLANKCLLYRIEHGFIREELGNKINVSATTIERIEKEDNFISSKLVSQIKSLIKKSIL